VAGLSAKFVIKSFMSSKTEAPACLAAKLDHKFLNSMVWCMADSLLPVVRAAYGAIMQRLIAAFGNSCRALARAYRSEPAVRQEIYLLFAAVPLAFLLTDDGWRRAELLGAVMVLIAIELLNTAIEKLCDHIHPGRHEAIGYVKDLGSAAVLMGILFVAFVWLVAIWQWIDRVV
jgi:diacylglycerol kinase (ATP)